MTPSEEKKQLRAQLDFIDAIAELGILAQRAAGDQTIAEPKIPGWCLKCFAKYWTLIARNVPSLNEEEAGHDSAENVGFRLGYMFWLRNWIKTEFIKLPKRKSPEFSEESIRIIAAAWNRVLGFEGQDADKESEEFWKFIDDERQTISLSPEFKGLADHKAYVDGISKGMDGISGLPGGGVEDSSAVQLYAVLFLFWRKINPMTSITEMHTWLSKTFGAHHIGDKKRIEQTCRRMGLRFRGKGRPRKSYIPRGKL